MNVNTVIEDKSLEGITCATPEERKIVEETIRKQVTPIKDFRQKYFWISRPPFHNLDHRIRTSRTGAGGEGTDLSLPFPLFF